MQKYTANKNFGQHFLKDKSVIQKIIKTIPMEAEVIFEIGPGTGAITFPLKERQEKTPYYLFEKDDRFAEIYKEGFHVNLVDAVKFDFNKFIQENKLKNIFLVSNLPYNVGSVIYTNLLPIQEIRWMCLMFQKEVGEKTLLNKEDKLSSLSFLTTNYLVPKKISLVPPGCFSPPPKVNSIVNFYTRKSETLLPDLNFNQIEHYVRKLFLHPRKTLRGKLGKEFKQFKTEGSFLSEFAGQRAEDLSVTEIQKIINEMHSN
ncbi:hypothetical protein N9N67_01800 [Bacteriovoracaceae bacterium]|nr:hypothetical protein [Bacteriovoracaceae bacterium]